MKKQVLNFLHFQFRKILLFLLFFEWKKMRFLLYALQFGKELLEVKSKAEQKRFGRDICSSVHEKTPEVPVAFQRIKDALYLHEPIHALLLNYFSTLLSKMRSLSRFLPAFSRNFSSRSSTVILLRAAPFTSNTMRPASIIRVRLPSSSA